MINSVVYEGLVMFLGGAEGRLDTSGTKLRKLPMKGASEFENRGVHYCTLYRFMSSEFPRTLTELNAIAK